MDESRDKRVMDLVHTCAEMSAEARARFLDVECNGDGELRSKVEQLIAIDETSSNVLSNHLDAHLWAQASRLEPGEDFASLPLQDDDVTRVDAMRVADLGAVHLP